MHLDALKTRLLVEGYGDLVHELRPWGLMISDLHLKMSEGMYIVAWTERGAIVEQLLASADEGAACECFHDVVSGQKWHFRTFRTPPEADALTILLRAGGIKVSRNDIPDFNGPGDARYRLFLAGRDLARAEEIAAARTGNTTS